MKNYYDECYRKLDKDFKVFGVGFDEHSFIIDDNVFYNVIYSNFNVDAVIEVFINDEDGFCEEIFVGLLLLVGLELYYNGFFMLLLVYMLFVELFFDVLFNPDNYLDFVKLFVFNLLVLFC